MAKPKSITVNDPEAQNTLRALASRMGVTEQEALLDLIRMTGAQIEAASLQYLDAQRWLLHRPVLGEVGLGGALNQLNDRTAVLGYLSDIGMAGSLNSPNTHATALGHLSLFQTKVDCAAAILSTAFAASSVADFRAAPRRAAVRPESPAAHWYTSVVNASLDRYREVRNALVHNWTPTEEAGRMASEAFYVLATLTHAADRLIEIHHVDPARAKLELTKLLDPIAEEVAATARLYAGQSGSAVTVAQQDAAAAVQADVLAKAGGVWTLRQTAEAMDISRQAIHKRIVKGTLIGIMRGKELAVPMAQFEQTGVISKATPGLGKIVALFREAQAGDWSALQFLVEHDPNLNAKPIDVLKARQARRVEQAARAYLGLDEG
jgi:hypothetical protein